MLRGTHLQAPDMDDIFSGPIPFPDGKRSSLPRMADLTLDADTVGALAVGLRRPGRLLTLLTVSGTVLHDGTAPAGRPWADNWPDVSRPLIEGAVSYARGGAEVMFEVITPDMSDTRPPTWWRIHLTPVLTRDGSGIQFLKALAADITGRMDQKHRRAREDWLPGASAPGLAKVSG